MEWLSYPEHKPTNRKDVFIRTIDNHYYVTKYIGDKFITYCTVTHFCEPDPIIDVTNDINVITKETTKKRGRPKKTGG